MPRPSSGSDGGTMSDASTSSNSSNEESSVFTSETDDGSEFPIFQAMVRRVYVSTKARDVMLAHAREGAKLEAMGLLIGETDQVESVITVHDAIPVTIGKEAEVEFDAEHYEVFERDFSPFWIVGWYHSHPGYGLFLSGTDIATHANGFQAHNPLSIAIVVDHQRPDSSTMAAFQVDNHDSPQHLRQVQVPLSLLDDKAQQGESDS